MQQGGWRPSPASTAGREENGGAPLRFSRSGPPDCQHQRGQVLCRRWSNLHREHFPFVHFDRTRFAERVGAETAPAPQFRRRHQSALHWIAVHVHLVVMKSIGHNVLWSGTRGHFSRASTPHKLNRPQCRPSDGPLLEKREKWGTPFSPLPTFPTRVILRWRWWPPANRVGRPKQRIGEALGNHCLDHFYVLPTADDFCWYSSSIHCAFFLSSEKYPWSASA